MDERVTARIARQALLARKGPPIAFVFILEEAALHRMVGGKDVMKQQFAKLLELGRARNVEIQIMPSTWAAHSGLNGPMVLLETKYCRQFVYLEVQDIVSVGADRAKASEFWLRYGMLRSQALNTEESACSSSA